jgi:hypothetical protein
VASAAIFDRHLASRKQPDAERSSLRRRFPEVAREDDGTPK